MASNDAQLVIESDEELPAGPGNKTGDEIIRNTVRGGESARAHIKIPFTTCQSFINDTDKDELNRMHTS
jgi:hypothetical protein